MHASRCSPLSPWQRTSRCSGSRRRALWTVLDEGAVPAGPHELLSLGGAEPARVGLGGRGQRRAVRAERREPVVVVSPLGAIGRRPRAERPAELERRCEAVGVDAHERVPETVNAAVALVPRAGVGADGRGLPGRRGSSDGATPVTSPCANPALQPGSLLRGSASCRSASVSCSERVGAPDRVHDAVAALQDEAAFAPGGRLDRTHRRPRVAPAGNKRLELAQITVAGCFREEATAARHVDATDRRVGPVACQNKDSCRHHCSEGDAAEGGAARRRGPPRLPGLLLLDLERGPAGRLVAGHVRRQPAELRRRRDDERTGRAHAARSSPRASRCPASTRRSCIGSPPARSRTGTWSLSVCSRNERRS